MLDSVHSGSVSCRCMHLSFIHLFFHSFIHSFFQCNLKKNLNSVLIICLCKAFTFNRLLGGNYCDDTMNLGSCHATHSLCSNSSPCSRSSLLHTPLQSFQSSLIGNISTCPFKISYGELSLGSKVWQQNGCFCKINIVKEYYLRSYY